MNIRDLYVDIANEYIKYSTGQANTYFPRADSWMLYKLTTKYKYNNPFPPFQRNKDRLFGHLTTKLNISNKMVTGLYLVRHTNRSFQVPISNKLHGYVPISSLKLVIGKYNLLHKQGIEDPTMFKFDDHKLKYRIIEAPIFFNPEWCTLPYVKEGDTYFYVEFGE